MPAIISQGQNVENPQPPPRITPANTGSKVSRFAIPIIVGVACAAAITIGILGCLAILPIALPISIVIAAISILGLIALGITVGVLERKQILDQRQAENAAKQAAEMAKKAAEEAAKQAAEAARKIAEETAREAAEAATRQAADAARKAAEDAARKIAEEAARKAAEAAAKQAADAAKQAADAAKQAADAAKQAADAAEKAAGEKARKVAMEAELKRTAEDAEVTSKAIEAAGKQLDVKVAAAGRSSTNPPFDEAASDALAQLGESLLAEDSKARSFEIQRLHAGSEKGFGTAAIRKAVKKSLAKDYEGRVHCNASRSSHIFYLKMGMLPVERQVSHLRLYYGLAGEAAEKYYPQVIEKLRAGQNLDEEESDALEQLKSIIRHELNLDKRDIIKNQTVLDKTKLLGEVFSKSVSFITHKFIPDLLNILERHKKASKTGIPKNRPNTDGMDSVHMKLSEAGLKEWQLAIHERRGFQLFRDFTQLREYMTPEQLKRFNAAMVP